MHGQSTRIALAAVVACAGFIGLASPALGQRGCDIPAQARDIWRCENGFVIGPENVIIRLPIAETDPEALYRAGVEAANRKDWRVAIAYFMAAHQQAHLVPKYMYNLGLAHARAGHEVAAIGWLAAYLVAEPNAPNRAAIWDQIRGLEVETNRKIALLWDEARKATLIVPEVPIGEPVWGNTERAATRSYLAIVAARAGDANRANEFGGSKIAASAVSNPSFIGDLGIAETEALLAGMTNPPLEAQQRLDERKKEARERWEWWKTPDPGWVRYRDPPRWASATGGDYLYVSPDERVQKANKDLSGKYAHLDNVRILALAALGRAKDALDELAKLTPEGWRSEAIAADVAVILIAVHGDRTNARRALTIAKSIADRASASSMCAYASSECAGEGRDNPHGWWTARATALLISEEQSPIAAVDYLNAFVSRRFGTPAWDIEPPGGYYVTGRSRTFAPEQRWQLAKVASINEVTSLLYMRRRFGDALQLLPKHDSLSRMYWLDRLGKNRDAAEFAKAHGVDLPALKAQALAGASRGGETIPLTQRIELEEMINLVRKEGGAAYDLEWWTGRPHNKSTSARQKVIGLAVAAEDLARGVRRIRTQYTLERKWGE